MLSIIVKNYIKSEYFYTKVVKKNIFIYNYPYIKKGALMFYHIDLDDNLKDDATKFAKANGYRTLKRFIHHALQEAMKPKSLTDLVDTVGGLPPKTRLEVTRELYEAALLSANANEKQGVAL